MTTFPYKARIALAATGYLLKLARNKWHVLPLVKALYEAERESIRNYGLPMFGDEYASMDNGPVVRHTYDCLKKRGQRGFRDDWREFVARENESVVLVSDPGVGPLNRAQLEILKAVFERVSAKYRELGYKRFVHEFCHSEFPEWQNPHKSSIPITVEDMLEAMGRHDDIPAVRSNALADRSLQEALDSLSDAND